MGIYVAFLSRNWLSDAALKGDLCCLRGRFGYRRANAFVAPSYMSCSLIFPRHCQGQDCRLCKSSWTGVQGGVHYLAVTSTASGGVTLFVDRPFEQPERWIFCHVPCLTAQQAFDFLKEHEGKPFNKRGFLWNFMCCRSYGATRHDDSTEAFFCSELVCVFLGQHLEAFRSLTPCRTSPQMLFDALEAEAETLGMTQHVFVAPPFQLTPL